MISLLQTLSKIRNVTFILQNFEKKFQERKKKWKKIHMQKGSLDYSFDIFGQSLDNLLGLLLCKINFLDIFNIVDFFLFLFYYLIESIFSPKL